MKLKNSNLTNKKMKQTKPQSNKIDEKAKEKKLISSSSLSKEKFKKLQNLNFSNQNEK